MRGLTEYPSARARLISSVYEGSGWVTRWPVDCKAAAALSSVRRFAGRFSPWQWCMRRAMAA